MYQCPVCYIYKGLDIPFSARQTDVIKAQCLRAMISTGTSFCFFDDPEVQELLKMMRTAAELGGSFPTFRRASNQGGCDGDE